MSHTHTHTHTCTLLSLRLSSPPAHHRRRPRHGPGRRRGRPTMASGGAAAARRWPRRCAAAAQHALGAAPRPLAPAAPAAASAASAVGSIDTWGRAACRQAARRWCRQDETVVIAAAAQNRTARVLRHDLNDACECMTGVGAALRALRQRIDTWGRAACRQARLRCRRPRRRPRPSPSQPPPSALPPSAPTAVAPRRRRADSGWCGARCGAGGAASRALRQPPSTRAVAPASRIACSNVRAGWAGATAHDPVGTSPEARDPRGDDAEGAP